MSVATDSNKLFDDNRFFLRLSAMLLAGVLVAGFLTWFMYILIEFSEQKADEGARVQILDFVRLQRDETSKPKERRAERPEVTEAPPAPTAPDLSDASDISPLAVSQIPVDTHMGVDMGGFGVGISEGEFLPIVKVAPVYPATAANRGIEGECMVEYTVTTAGSTTNISVVEGRCSHSVFRRPSIEAASKFKYKPRIVGGEAVEVERVRNLFHYTLTDG